MNIFVFKSFSELVIFYDKFEEGQGDARGRRYGDICICIADSLCYTAETNTPL